MAYLKYDSTDGPYEGLDRCHRCGGEADIRIWSLPLGSGWVNRDTYYYVCCLDCGLMTNPYCLTVDEAKKKWNQVKNKENATPYANEANCRKCRYGEWVQTSAYCNVGIKSRRIPYSQWAEQETFYCPGFVPTSEV